CAGRSPCWTTRSGGCRRWSTSPAPTARAPAAPFCARWPKPPAGVSTSTPRRTSCASTSASAWPARSSRSKRWRTCWPRWRNATPARRSPSSRSPPPRPSCCSAACRPTCWCWKPASAAATTRPTWWTGRRRRPSPPCPWTTWSSWATRSTPSPSRRPASSSPACPAPSAPTRPSPCWSARRRRRARPCSRAGGTGGS
ncbi:MAG: Dihydrofolate synthase @ Folylpolyglutamate synthase, partial [uncultured Acetobacteraceae bacterium]